MNSTVNARFPSPTNSVAIAPSSAKALNKVSDQANLCVPSATSNEHYNELYVDRVTSLEQLRALKADWDALHTVSGNRFPFSTHAWTYHWWRHFHEDRVAVKDSLSILTVRNSDGDAVAIAPFMLTQHPGVGPLRVRFMQFIGADPHLTEIRGPLVRPDYDGPALQCILDTLQADSSAWDWVKWSGIATNSMAARILARVDNSLPAGQISDYVLPLAPTWEEFRGKCKRNIRESLRKCYNSLARDGHTFDFKVAETPEEVETALGHFFMLHEQRAKQPDSVPHKDRFASAKARAFLIDVCKEMAATRSAKVFTLTIGRKVVAARVGFVVNGSLYLYYSGYDPEWGQYSVMTTTVAEAVKYSIAQGLESVGLSTGKDVSKTRWGPDELSFSSFTQKSILVRGQVGHRAYSQVRKVRNQELVKSLVRRWLFRRSS